ncbi:CYTH domain-containing protein [Celerinatantimonas sp. YJH-8]|uniref:CYTH and CHAD domain-containing protein n=1 Tax=Celerinatantimonas sp. YJH-8 TaxID=3228714 RepID=UPI0038C36808
MNSEIELKFYAPDGCLGALQHILDEFSILQHEIRHLRSVYFDTTERHLRRLQMGLRIRTGDEQNVQTLKTAGRNIGGLHERPEFNQVIEGNHPELGRFEHVDWPDDIDLMQLETQLLPIFVTDFLRTTWLIDLENETLIEVALDSGQLQADDKQEPIQEIELELVKGDVAQLFLLARQLTQLEGIQLVSTSKAKRGYALADELPAEQSHELTFVPLSTADSISDAFMHGLEYALQHWQSHQQIFNQTDDLTAVKQLKQAAMLMHQVLTIYQDVLEFDCEWHDELLWLARQMSWVDEVLSIEKLLDQQGEFIRKLPNRRAITRYLEECRQSLPDLSEIHQLLSSPRYNRLVVDIVSWLNQGERARAKQELSLIEFAVSALEYSWSELKESDLGSEKLEFSQYERLAGLLRRNLMVGNCFGNLFPTPERDDFRLLWFDILGGIEDLRVLEPIADMLETADDDDDARQIRKWLQRKQESIVDAMEFTRIEVLLRQDYWHSYK